MASVRKVLRHFHRHGEIFTVRNCSAAKRNIYIDNNNNYSKVTSKNKSRLEARYRLFEGKK